MTDLVVGVDVSKDWIDVCDAEGHHEKIESTRKLLRAFARRMAKAGAFVVFEATGGYDAPLREALEAAGAAYARVNPARARDFARATGVLGKTDRIDAALLREMGRRLDLKPTEPVSPARKALKARVARRAQLVEQRKQERTRLHQAGDAFVRRSLKQSIATLSARIAVFDKAIATVIRDEDGMGATAIRLQTAPGVGSFVAAMLLAEVPELGTLDRRSVAALVGLAPVPRDSGKRNGPRAIRGGRPAVRSMLYLAALQASRRHPVFKAFRDQLEARGKTPKQAIVATARKRIVTLNAMIKTDTDFNPATE